MMGADAVENPNIAEELTKLAALHDRGLLSAKEFESQKRALLSQSQAHLATSALRTRKSALVVSAAFVLIVGAVVVGFATTSSKPSTPDKVEVATVAATSGQVGAAIDYARKYVGKNHDDGWCLQFVAEAWRAGGISLKGEPTAAAYWAANPNGFPRVSSSSYGTPPAGALLFWGARPGYSAGHVAISVGNGTAISTSAVPYYQGIRGDPRVFVMTLSQRSPNAYNYVGYLMPGGLPASSHPPTQDAAPSPIHPSPSPSSSGSSGGASSGSSPGNGGSPSSGGTKSSPAPVGGAAPAGPIPSGGASGSSGSGVAITSPTPGPTSGGVSQTSTTTTTTTELPSPPPTFSETVGGVSHTWTNYSNAGGNEGPSIASNQTVQIACKVTGFRVSDGDTWWYRIASSPWNNNYYVSADAFYNNGTTSGTLHGTPFVDPAVPNC